MRNIRFDWRWVGLIIVVAIIANAQFLPWPVLMLVLGGSGGYLLFVGWQVWNREGGPRPGGHKRVKYWRGQRIELDDSPRRGGKLPTLRAITPALIYFLIGGALLLGAIALVVRNTSG